MSEITEKMIEDKAAELENITAFGWEDCLEIAELMLKEVQNRVLTCVYCGHEYPQNSPSWGNKVLTDHIKVCPKHPLRVMIEALNKIKELNGPGLDGSPANKEYYIADAALESLDNL